MKKRAIIGVSDKTGVVDFAKGLAEHGYEIVSTGGTYKLLKSGGVDALYVSDVTGFPEILDGRVKTLHPHIHGGILAVRDNPSHAATLSELGITSIDLVAVNLYPFKETIQKENVTDDEAIENIDIGGPTMIRAAAKNHKYVTVAVDPADYSVILDEISNGDISAETKRKLAAKAFRHTAAYDALIAGYLTEETYPELLTVTYEKKQNLRYGENPHQQAALYAEPLPHSSVITAKQLNGKELSYNNIADADVALALASEFRTPAAVAVKHQNPCGVGIGETLFHAYARAYEADPVSIFGGIVALNREVDAALALELNKTFLEVLIAPSFSAEAVKILMKKKNLRLLEKNDMRLGLTKNTQYVFFDQQFIKGGLLIQDSDSAGFRDANLSFPTIRKPTKAELKTAEFAWTVVKYIKSNGILVARENMTVGIGPGQTNRVGAAKIALSDAGERARGAVLASDAFFPMPDTVEEAAAAGVHVIIQPGGSVKDAESVAECDKNNIAMIFTGIRHFKH